MVLQLRNKFLIVEEEMNERFRIRSVGQLRGVFRSGSASIQLTRIQRDVLAKHEKSAAVPSATTIQPQMNELIIGWSVNVMSENDRPLTFSRSTSTIGDVNRDGSVNLLDAFPFVNVLSNGSYQLEADINKDQSVDLLDVAGFVDLLN